MPLYNEDADCDGCGDYLTDGAECYCEACYGSVVKQLEEVLEIKRKLEAEIEVLNLEKQGAY